MCNKVWKYTIVLLSAFSLKNRADKMQDKPRSFSLPKATEKCHFRQLKNYPQIHMGFALD